MRHEPKGTSRYKSGPVELGEGEEPGVRAGELLDHLVGAGRGGSAGSSAALWSLELIDPKNMVYSGSCLQAEEKSMMRLCFASTRRNRTPTRAASVSACSYLTSSQTSVLTLILPSRGNGAGLVVKTRRSPSFLMSRIWVVPVQISFHDASM